MSQQALFPMRHLNVTRKYGIASHVGSYAVDLAGKDTKIDDVYAPFDCVVKKVWPNGNTVWFQSLAPVKCADGSMSIVTVSMTHDNSVTGMYLGRIFKQGAVIYQEGTAGNATGNHVHLEASKKPFRGTGWHQNSQGFWVINDGAKPESIFVLQNVTVINGGGIIWKKGVTVNNTKPVTYARANQLAHAVLLRGMSEAEFIKHHAKKTELQLFEAMRVSAEHKAAEAKLKQIITPATQLNSGLYLVP